MVRMILWFLVLAALAAGVAWLADRPGEIVIDWLGYRIETSLALALLALIAVLAVLSLAWGLLRRIVHIPAAVTGYARNRRRRRGYEALSRGIVAVAARDRDAARRHSEVAARLLPGDPMARLLEAQAAQLRGDHARVERVFADMLADPETEVVALRGLYLRALQAGKEGRARDFAERAYRRQPGLDWAADAVLRRQAAQRDWPAVLTVIEAQRRSKLLDEDTARRKRAVVLTAQAVEAEPSDVDAALDLSSKALKIEPGLVPAAVVAARANFARGSLKRGLKVLERAWSTSPHPDIAQAYAHARPGESARDRLARIRTLVAVTPGGEEGAVALARAAIEARDWAMAREALADQVSGRPRARVCVLMAEIEEGEFGDRGRAREWLSRAVVAPRDPAWVADGFVSDRWHPVSPVTDELGAFVWKVPLESLGYSGPAPQVAAPPPAVIEAQPAPPPPPAPPRRSEPIPAPVPKPEPETPAAPRPEIVQTAAASRRAEATPVRPSEIGASGGAVAPRQPDDPGPEAEAQRGGWVPKPAEG
jgi:HemY protein